MICWCCQSSSLSSPLASLATVWSAWPSIPTGSQIYCCFESKEEEESHGMSIICGFHLSFIYLEKQMDSEI